MSEFTLDGATQLTRMPYSPFACHALHQPDDAPLGRVVVREIGKAAASCCRRRDRDGASPAADHVGQHRATGDEDAGQIRVDDRAPLLWRQLVHLAEPEQDPGVADEVVDCAELRHCRCDRCAHVVGVSHVGDHGHAPPAEGLHHLPRLVQLFLRSSRVLLALDVRDAVVHERYVRAFAGQGQRVRAALPLGTAHDQRHRILESAHAASPSLTCARRAVGALLCVTVTFRLSLR